MFVLGLSINLISYNLDTLFSSVLGKASSQTLGKKKDEAGRAEKASEEEQLIRITEEECTVHSPILSEAEVS